MWSVDKIYSKKHGCQKLPIAKIYEQTVNFLGKSSSIAPPEHIFQNFMLNGFSDILKGRVSQVSWRLSCFNVKL